MTAGPYTGPPVQDMPPKGGFPEIQVARNLKASRGPSGAALWLGTSLAIFYGFSQVGRYNKEKGIEKQLERERRYAIAPVLQADEDRSYLIREIINIKKEQEIMKDVQGHEAGKSQFGVSGKKKWAPRFVHDFKHYG